MSMAMRKALQMDVKTKPMPNWRYKARIKRQAKFNHEMYATLDSSQYAEALQIGDYQIPPIYAEPLHPTIQYAEMNGTAKTYPTEAHKTLIQTVVPLRSAFRKTQDPNERTEIAEEELKAWKAYLEHQKERIRTEDEHSYFRIGEKTKSLLKEQHDRMKHRESYGVPSEELIEYHSEFSKKFKFDVPINPDHF